METQRTGPKAIRLLAVEFLRGKKRLQELVGELYALEKDCSLTEEAKVLRAGICLLAAEYQAKDLSATGLKALVLEAVLLSRIYDSDGFNAEPRTIATKPVGADVEPIPHAQVWFTVRRSGVSVVRKPTVKTRGVVHELQVNRTLAGLGMHAVDGFILNAVRQACEGDMDDEGPLGAV